MTDGAYKKGKIGVPDSFKQEEASTHKKLTLEEEAHAIKEVISCPEERKKHLIACVSAHNKKPSRPMSFLTESTQ